MSAIAELRADDLLYPLRYVALAAAPGGGR
jgi:hypothetical protein